MSRRPGRVVAIAGPTCTGKTALAVEIALRIGAELVNADSRQVRSGLVVGTCAPTAEQLRGVRCHLAGIVAPGVPYTVADWLAAARPLIAGRIGDGVDVIVVGGTGLYMRALLEGYTLAGPADPSRRTCDTTHEAMVEELSRRAPDVAAATDVANPRRVIRALEALDLGTAPSRLATHPAQDAVRIGLDAEVTVHDMWIQRRTEAMFSAGLIQETENALATGIAAGDLAGCGIGYREAIAVVRGELTLEAAVAETARRTRRYARSQRTFFKGVPWVRWLDAAQPRTVLAPTVAALRDD